MRLGDHMMLIQLQLSSVTPSTTRKSNSNVSIQQNQKSNESYVTKPNVPSTSEGSSYSSGSSSSSSSSNSSDTDLSLPNLNLIKSKLNTLLHKNNENLNALKRKFNSREEGTSVKKSKSDDDNKSSYFKDLNLKNVLLNVSDTNVGSEGKICKYNDLMKESTGESSKIESNQDLQTKKSEILSQIMESVRKISENTTEMSEAIEGKVCDKEISGYGSKCNVNCTCTNKSGYSLGTGIKNSDSAALDTKALAEASRNLTQTLKQLSSEVLTCRSENSDVSSFKLLIFLKIL